MKSLTVRIWLSFLLVLLMAYTGYSLWKRGSANRPPEIAETPASSDPTLVASISKPLNLASYTMTERSGEPICFDKLRGKVWIGSMFFSTCTMECVALNRTIAALHNDPLFKDIEFVSITVDPGHDSPQILSNYAKEFGADPKRWLFVTGSLSDTVRFGEDIKVGVETKHHMSRLLLFDRQAKLRGLFQFDDPHHIERLRAMVPELLQEPAAAAATGKTATSE